MNTGRPLKPLTDNNVPVAACKISLFRSVAQTIVGNGAVALFSFATSILLARALLAEGRGELALLQLVMVVVTAIAHLGLPNAYLYLARTESPTRQIPLLIFLLSTVAVCASVFSVIGAYIMEIKVPALLIAACGAVYATQQALLLLLQTIHGLKAYNILNAATSLSLLLAVMLGLKLNFTSTQYFYVQIVVCGLAILPMAAVILTWCFEQTAQKHASKHSSVNFRQAVFKLIKTGIGFYGVAVTSVVIANIDKVVIAQTGALKALGTYVAAYSITRAISIIQGSLSTALYSRFAGENENVTLNHISFSFRITFIPLIIATSGLAWFSDDIVSLMLGEGYKGAGIIFSLLAFEAVISASGWMLAQYFTSAGKSNIVFLRQLVSMVPFAACPFVITIENVGTVLAGTLLASSLIRLFFTLALIKRHTREQMPRLYPSLSDIHDIASILTKR